MDPTGSKDAKNGGELGRSSLPPSSMEVPSTPGDILSELYYDIVSNIHRIPHLNTFLMTYSLWSAKDKLILLLN